MVKPTEDNCEAYFTQQVPNVTCQIYSVVDEGLSNKLGKNAYVNNIKERCVHIYVQN
jgi:hypothetical protein